MVFKRKIDIYDDFENVHDCVSHKRIGPILTRYKYLLLRYIYFQVLYVLIRYNKRFSENYIEYNVLILFFVSLLFIV